MSQNHHIYLLAGRSAAGLPQRQRGARPFLPPVESSFAVHETPEGDAIYSIFEQDFLLSAAGKDEILKKYPGCTPLNRQIIACNQTGISDEEISRSLRRSASLRIDEHNCFITGRGVKIVFSPHGVHISRERLWNTDEKNLEIWAQDAEKAIECYLLALAYQKKSDGLLQRAIAAFDKGQAQEMIDARDALCAFDLKYFFANPVRMEVFETHALWRMAAWHCGVQAAHDEIKGQIVELATIIENRRRDAEETRQRRLERNLTLIGLFLSAVSLLELVKSFWR